MDTFVKIVTQINDWVWSLPLVLLCLGAGIFFTFLTKGCQFRLIKDMFKLVRARSKAELEGEEKGKGISAF